MRTLLACVLAALLCLCAAPASAHLLNMSKVQISIGDDAQINATMSLDLTRAAGSGAAYFQLSRSAQPLSDAQWQATLAALNAALQLQLDGAAIPLQVMAVTPPQLPESDFLSPVAWPMTELRLQGRLPPAALQGSGSLQMRFDSVFPFEEPIALTLQLGDSGRRMTRWLVAGQQSPAFALQAAPVATATTPDNESTIATLWQYLRFGFQHILPRGLDHLLFVLGLYLGSRSLRSLLALVTAFTVAHSATLILSSFGALRLPANVVEPLIALSIAWIGIENLLSPRVHRGRIALVFGFGLLHGLGFAAALKELGLPPSNFLGALLSFNLGVEFGQLAVIVLALLLTGRWRKRPGYRRGVVMPASLAITLLALAWAVQRLGVIS